MLVNFYPSILIKIPALYCGAIYFGIEYPL